MDICKHGTFEQAIPYTTIISISPTVSSTVTDYPTESAFYSYNKTQKPLEIKIELVGDVDTLAALNDYQNSVELVDIYTDDAVYLNYSLQSFDYSLTRDTGTLLVASMVFKQVLIVEPQYTNIPRPKKASRASISKRGQQLGKEVGAAEKKSALKEIIEMVKK